MSDDHERIWLQNAIDAGHTEEGRLWCPDKVWPDAPEDGEPTEYVRADFYVAAQAKIERLRDEVILLTHEIERLRELFRIDGEQHAAHVNGITEQYETRLAAYAVEIERLRAELKRLREERGAYGELFKKSSEKSVYIAECEDVMDRLRAENERLEAENERLLAEFG